MTDAQAHLLLQGQPLGCRCRATAGGAVTARLSFLSLGLGQGSPAVACTGAVTELQPNGGAV